MPPRFSDLKDFMPLAVLVTTEVTTAPKTAHSCYSRNEETA